MEKILIINVTCNPPSISIIGPVKESTIEKLNEVLPGSCTTTNTGKVPFGFVRREEPPHWYGELHTQFASEDIGQSQLFIALLDAIEEEGGWRLCGCNALNHDFEKVTHKLFFVRA
ncbi:putative mitochondrial paraflagellar rod component, putative (PFC16) [Trypanosoma theileri]|uniref:Putative mitochondrial paraflagellar rod component, putative (PFC16) n=1 Tax=Trypanosoma theileri TaxID=67003 RepID=A0A1X0P760_9TRYP|nr:putative mitochondrial paraflagellar rod component, putative (PFC16) [Trypanosoma theileri]ORC92762.1 putative mitochondrial paraflagellar rod component, putative (PFC16) [Trypanosoma theileri]